MIKVVTALLFGISVTMAMEENPRIVENPRVAILEPSNGNKSQHQDEMRQVIQGVECNAVCTLSAVVVAGTKFTYQLLQQSKDTGKHLSPSVAPRVFIYRTLGNGKDNLKTLFINSEEIPEESFAFEISRRCFDVISCTPSAQLDRIIANAFRELLSQDHLIFNISAALFIGEETYKIIKEIGNAGGIVVMSAGNQGLILNDPLRIKRYQDLLNFSQCYISWSTYFKEDIEFRKSVLVVGSYDFNDGSISPSSMLAGETQERFLLAPGEGIYSKSGTSCACAFVSGWIARLSKGRRTVTPNRIAQIILYTARKSADARRRPDIFSPSSFLFWDPNYCSISTNDPKIIGQGILDPQEAEKMLEKERS